MATEIPVIEIGEDGNIRTLYTDEVDLYEIGVVHHVERASTIEFNEERQEWEVIDAIHNKVVHRNKNRDAAIEWEIREFSPGGLLDKSRRGRSRVKP